jgi:hypothetical protein
MYVKAVFGIETHKQRTHIPEAYVLKAHAAFNLACAARSRRDSRLALEYVEIALHFHFQLGYPIAHLFHIPYIYIYICVCVDACGIELSMYTDTDTNTQVTCALPIRTSGCRW